MEQLIKLYMMMRENKMFVSPEEEASYRYLIHLHIEKEKIILAEELW